MEEKMAAEALATALATYTSLQATASAALRSCWQSKADRDAPEATSLTSPCCFVAGESLVKTDAVREMLKVGQLVGPSHRGDTLHCLDADADRLHCLADGCGLASGGRTGIQ